MQLDQAPDAAPERRLTATVEGDSVRVTFDGGRERAFPSSPDAILYADPSPAGIEQVLRRARAVGGDTAVVPVFNLEDGTTTATVVRWTGADSAVLTVAGVEMRAAVAVDGSLLGGVAPSANVRVVRLEGAHPLSTDHLFEAWSPISPPASPGEQVRLLDSIAAARRWKRVVWRAGRPESHSIRAAACSKAIGSRSLTRRPRSDARRPTAGQWRGATTGSPAL